MLNNSIPPIMDAAITTGCMLTMENPTASA